MDYKFDLINIFILLVLVSNSILGLFVYLSKKNEKVNKNFFVFSLTATFWGISMFLFRSFPEYDSGFFARILYASASMIPFVFLYFIRVFPTEKFSISRRAIQILSIPFLLIFSISLLTDYLVITSHAVIGSEPVILFHGYFHTIYAGYINLYFSICYVILFLKYFKSKGLEKVQMAYVIAGTLVGTIIGVTTNLVLPYIGNFSLNWMGQIGVISMVGAIAYSIMKHKLFDMKVLATQFIVVLLCISLFTRGLFSVDMKDFILNNIFLVITIIVGVFLIRSVIKEVKLREELDVSNTRLKNANQGQVNLIHLMNHQIKGRFGTAKNIFAELLTDDYGNMPEESRFMLQKGLEETNLGIQYVQSILKGASAENGSLPLEMKTLDFKKIVEDTYNDQKEKAEKKGLKTSLTFADGEFNVNGDELQLSEAVRNLMDNSVNYTLEGSIDVSLSVEGNKIRLQVKDSGVGLTDDDKSKLFKSGGRGSESLKVNVNSTGYGLAFVKGVIEAHSGYVWAESEGRGKGSTFILELPKI